MGYPQLCAPNNDAHSRAFSYLTLQCCDALIAAFFRSARHGHAADLPTFENPARSPARLSRTQPHARRTQSAAQSTRARSPATRAVAPIAAAAKRFGLDAQRRLRRKAQFERLLREGERRSDAGYKFYFKRRPAGRPRLGILISRKHAASAVDRNRIKRSIREAFRLEQAQLGSIDLLVRPPYTARRAAGMVDELRGLLCRLNA
jgi:ribonuclease P protein component